jgi:hypothetical protein
MRPRNPEHREDRVAHELLQKSFVAGDLLGETVERATDDRLDHLRILALGQRGRAHEIREQGRRELPFLAALDPRERFAAVQAEASAFGVLLAAAGAGQHGPQGRTAAASWRDANDTDGPIDRRASDRRLLARGPRRETNDATWIFVSGQIAQDPDGTLVGPDAVIEVDVVAVIES